MSDSPHQERLEHWNEQWRIFVAILGGEGAVAVAKLANFYAGLCQLTEEDSEGLQPESWFESQVRDAVAAVLRLDGIFSECLDEFEELVA